MKKIHQLLIVLFAVNLSCVQQNEDANINKIKNSNLNSVSLNLPVADVTILGTFHYVANVDSYKRRFDIDLESSKVQKELNQLVNKLSKYNSTKVLVEYPIAYQEHLDSLYQEYRKGNFELENTEIFQLGFRLAKSMNNEHIYAVDVQAPLDLEYPVDDWQGYARETGQAEKLNYINSKFEAFYGLMDSLKTTMPLLDYYRLLNSKEITKTALQEKLSGLIELGATETYLGADGITLDYRRNLRIYANILSLIENKNDRFLLIIGSNHNTILQPLFETSLEFNYTDVVDFLE